MITAGIDVGAKSVKVVLLEEGEIIGRVSSPAGFDAAVSSAEALTRALSEAGIERSALAHVAATGVGHEDVAHKNSSVSDVTAAARGAVRLMPRARTVLDVGAEEGRAIRCDGVGKVIDFAMNEKCAAGAGTFVESMARALDMPIESMGELSLQSRQAVPMNAQCAVFAESEVVSLIHARTAKEDIVRAVHEAMADRIISMARRVGIEDDVVLIGGVGRNIGFVEAVRSGLQMSVAVPEDPEFASALGAAVVAADRARGAAAGEEEVVGQRVTSAWDAALATAGKA